MALQTINGGALIPGLILHSTAALGYAVSTLNDSNDAVGYVFQIPKNGNIHSIGFRTGTVTTGDTLRVGLYTTDATTGMPTSTAYKGMAVGTQVVADSDDNTWFTVNLGTDATSVVAGDIVAAVVDFNSYVAGNLQISTNFPVATFDFCYATFFEAAWAKLNTGYLVIYLKYSDGTVAYIPETLPLTAAASQAFNTGTSPDQYALKFQIPFVSRLSGVSLLIAVVGNFNIILYDSDGTSILTSVSHDKDYVNDTGLRRLSIRFPSPVALSANHVYYLAVKPTSASNVSIHIMTFPEAAALDQVEGGQNFHLASNSGGGAWTPVTTQVPIISLLLDQFDDGTGTVVGGSGMLVHPGMQGGCRG